MSSMPPGAADSLQPHEAGHRHACSSSFFLLLYLADQPQDAGSEDQGTSDQGTAAKHVEVCAALR